MTTNGRKGFTWSCQCLHLKWCLIMLKEYREGRGTENHLERIEDYFENLEISCLTIIVNSRLTRV